MNELVKFYKSLLEALDLEIRDTGQIFVKSSGTSLPLIIGDLPVYLPTDENIKTFVDVSSGQPKQVKVLFNPFQESAIKGENKSFLKLKTMIEIKIFGAIYAIGSTIFQLANEKTDAITDIDLMNMIAMFNTYKAPGIKTILDDTTVEIWSKLYANIIESYIDKQYIKLYVKRGGKLDGIKYNRVGNIAFPFAEELAKVNPKHDKFLDVKIRTKDKHVFLSFFKHMMSGVDLDKGVSFGSLNKVAPGTHVLLTMYDFLYNKLKPLIDGIGIDNVDEDMKLRLTLKPLPLPISVLGDFIDNNEGIIKTIPVDANSAPQQSSTDTNKPIVVNNNSSSGSDDKKDFWSRVSAKRTTKPQAAVPQTSVTPSPQYAINRNSPGYSPWANQQMPIQQPIIQQPMMQQPMMQQPMMQQPMIQQPMMQQPTMQQPIVVNSYNGRSLV